VLFPQSRNCVPYSANSGAASQGLKHGTAGIGAFFPFTGFNRKNTRIVLDTMPPSGVYLVAKSGPQNVAPTGETHEQDQSIHVEDAAAGAGDVRSRSRAEHCTRLEGTRAVFVLQAVLVVFRRL
jgi:hypothetical protein